MGDFFSLSPSSSLLERTGSSESIGDIRLRDHLSDRARSKILQFILSSLYVGSLWISMLASCTLTGAVKKCMCYFYCILVILVGFTPMLNKNKPMKWKKGHSSSPLTRLRPLACGPSGSREPKSKEQEDKEPPDL